MALIQVSDDLLCTECLQGAVCVIGVFDGLHKGHSHLISSANEEAKRLDAPLVVVTFDIDPDELLKPDAFKKLMSNQQRLEALDDMVDGDVAVISFNEQTSSMAPESFLDNMFSCRPSAVFTGKDFRFGKKGSGDIGMLLDWGKLNGVDVHPVELLEIDGEPVKSTKIRNLLSSGDVETAEEMLGRPYSIKGSIVSGRGDGSRMGIRTANMIIPDDQKALADGVYAAYAVVGGKRYKAAVSVGESSTIVDERNANLEVHILDFDEDIYDDEIIVEFKVYLRPMKRFCNVSDLIGAIQEDISKARAML